MAGYQKDWLAQRCRGPGVRIRLRHASLQLVDRLGGVEGGGRMDAGGEAVTLPARVPCRHWITAIVCLCAHPALAGE